MIYAKKVTQLIKEESHLHFGEDLRIGEWLRFLKGIFQTSQRTENAMNTDLEYETNAFSNVLW